MKQTPAKQNSLSRNNPTSGSIDLSRKPNPSSRSTADSIRTVPTLTQDQIAEHAYSLWEKDGFRHGNDQEHWYAAERSLGERSRSQ